MVSEKIASLFLSPHCSFGPLDDWHFCALNLRKFLRGWALNRSTESHREKIQLLDLIHDLDARADSDGLDAAGWAQRYAFE